MTCIAINDCPNATPEAFMKQKSKLIQKRNTSPIFHISLP